MQPVEDRAVRRVAGEARYGVAGHSDRRRRYQVPAVGEGGPEHRGEVPVRDWEDGCHRVVERQVSPLPVAHGHRSACGLDEPVEIAVVELRVGGRPSLAWLTVKLARGRHPEGMLQSAVRVWVSSRRLAV